MTPIFKQREVVVKVKPHDPNSTTFNTSRKNQIYEVVFTGNQCLNYKVGDKILVDDERGKEIEIDKQKYLVFFEDWVICEMKGEN